MAEVLDRPIQSSSASLSTTPVAETIDIQDEHMYASTGRECENCCAVRQQLNSMTVELEQLKAEGRVSRLKYTYTVKCSAFIANDKKVRLNTGLPNKAALKSLFGLLKPRASRMRYWFGAKRFSNISYKRKYRRTPRKSGPRRSLSLKDEFVLTLMKLRLALTNDFLCDLFGLSAGTCSSIINTWIKLLSKELACLVFWPSKEQIHQYMPQTLRNKYPSLRCTIDCSETFIERPRDLKLQACTWSDYKHHNTLKYLVAIAPDGLISFISRAWGGRTTDRYIVQKSGFLDLIEPYDLILADRGFTIREDLLFKNAYLEIPPPSAGLQQMARDSVLKTKKVANARIHVERAINRIKWFKFLSSTVPLSMVPLFDDILIICASICNMLGPLVE